MNEHRKPFVVLEHFDFDSASDVKLFNSKNDDHKLYVNMKPNCESVSDEDQREKTFYLKKSSQKVVSDTPVNTSKRVSFSNRARVLYFSEDTNALYSSVIDNGVHTSEQPLVEQPSDTESKYPQIVHENKQFHPLEKDVVIVLEKLPVDLIKQVKSENCDQRKCVQTVPHLTDSQNFNESFDLQLTESQVSELTGSTENILSDDKQKFKTDLPQFKTFLTDFSSELNVPFHQELKVSIKRLPDHLLEPYLNNNSFKSSEENRNSSKQENDSEDDLSLPETEVNFKLNDSSLLQHPALNTDVDSSRSTPSEPLKQEFCEHENNVYNSNESIRNPCVSTESLNGIGDSSYSIPSEPLKEESYEHKYNVYNSDVSIKNPCILNEVLNRDVNSSYSIPSEPLKQESCEHENNVYNCDVLIRNPYVLIERLNLIVPEIDSIPYTKKSQKQKRNKKDIFFDEQEDISGNLKETEPKIVLDSTDKPLIGSSKLSKVSKKKKRPPTVKSENARKNLECLPHQIKASNKKSKSHLQRNKTSMSLENIHFPSQKVTEVLVDSHNLNSTANVVKLYDLALTETNVLSESAINFQHTDSPLLLQTSEKYSTEHQSTISNNSDEDDTALSLLSKPDDVEHPNVSLSVYKQEKGICPLKNSNSKEQASDISNLSVSNMSTSTGNQCHMSNFSSSEDEIPLSLLHKLNNVKQTKTLGHIKKKKRRPEKSKTNGMQQFTDFSVMHVAEMAPPNSLTFMSEFKKKVKKTPSTKKIKRKILSEKEMLLFSHLNNMNNVKQTKILDHIEKKEKKRSQKSKTSGNKKFTDFNVMHVAEMTPPNSLTFMSDFKKKVKKTPSTKKIERKELPEKEMLLLSHLNSMDKVKQTKILNYIEKKKQRSQKSKTNGVQKSKDFNVMNIAEVLPSNSLTFTSDFKKKVKNTPSRKKIERMKTSKDELSFSRLSERNPFLAQVKESNLNKPIKSGAKECDNKLVLLSKQAKLNYVNGPTLIGHEDQASNCKNNSALHVKNISQSCYYETVESDADSDILPPLKEVKLDNYNSSCNIYKVNKNKSIAVPAKNNVKVTKKSRKKRDCQSKKKGTSNELHFALRNYLNKFFTEFDSLGMSKKKVVYSQKENKLVKKKENIYKMLIEEMHNHLKNTCSIKKSFKSQRLKEKLNKRSMVQIPHIKVESKNGFSSQSPRPKEDSWKRKGNKENCTDKFRLGFLTGDKFLALYNRCVAAERLILMKYKMKKLQRKKIKRFFKTLKKNSLRRN